MNPLPIAPLIKRLYLDSFGDCPGNLQESFEGLLTWLALTQRDAVDDGSSAGYSLSKKWLPSYPETTGYIIWTLIDHHDLFGERSWLERAARMARWEQTVQWPAGGIPGSHTRPSARMVVFNTGMVLLGWSAYYRATKDESVLQAAVKAGDWIGTCQDQDGAWTRGVSEAATSGRLAYNTMVAWALSELHAVTGLARFREMALKGVRYYAAFIDEDGWPDHSGISADERFRPLTHTIGYTLAGLYETAVLLDDRPLTAIAHRMASGLKSAVADDGFLPGRIGPGFTGKACWSCLTGSAQIAHVWLRMIEQGSEDVELLHKALSILEYIRGTQRVNTGDSGIDYAVPGSFPFSFNGYCRLTYPNWAAKFTLDCFHTLHRLSRHRPYAKLLAPHGFSPST